MAFREFFFACGETVLASLPALSANPAKTGYWREMNE